MKSISSHVYVLVREGISTDDVRVAATGTVFQELRRWAGFKTGDFVEEKLGGLHRRMNLLSHLFSSSRLSHAIYVIQALI